MPAEQNTDDDVFVNLPPDLSEGEARQAWKSKALIEKLMREGKELRQIQPPAHATLRGVKWVMQVLSGKPPGAMNQIPAPQTQGPNTESRVPGPESRVTNPIPESPPNSPDDDSGKSRSNPGHKNTVPDTGDPETNRQSNPPGATPPPRDRAQMASQLEAMTLADIGSPTGKSPLSGAYEPPDAMARLADMCRMLGMTPEKAKGVALSFAYQSKDNADFRKLREIVIGVGAAPGLADTIVNTWRSMNRTGDQSTGSATSDGGDGGTTLEDLERRLGVRPTGTGLEGEVERMNREEQQLRIQELKLALDEKRKALGLPGGAPTPNDDGMIEILLNVGGMPMPKRIRESQLPMWQPWIAKPPAPAGEKVAEEMPAWAKALQERLDRQDREREEDRRRQQEDERLKTVVAPLYEEIRKLREERRSPVEDTVVKELRQMREDRDKERNDAVLQELGRMRAAVAEATTPEGLRAAQHRYEQTARQLGFVPRGENALLNEEQIQLEAERKSAIRKDEATGKAIEILAKKVDKEPIQSLLEKTGLDQTVRKFVEKKIMQDPSDMNSTIEEPTDAQMEEAAKLLRGSVEQESGK